MMDTEESYRAYWATLTGRQPSDIYVPEALRDKPQSAPTPIVLNVDSPREAA